MDGFNLSSQKRGKGLISMLTAGLSLYLTAAMWTEFNSALSGLLGPSLGVVIGTLVFLVFQSSKNEKEFTQGGNYITSEATTIIRDENGQLRQVESLVEKGRNPAILIGFLYLMIVIMSEMSWSDLLS
ncbi:MAG: hypothetical protein P8R00_07230 [Candidatus Poseidoniaceae archaeon]|nr:hypothetical protein [Candidatus Poseidoniaceae archaeon]